LKYFLLLTLFFTIPYTVYAGDCPSLLNHQFKTLQGENIDLCEYRNQPILVVNTASRCGFTPQFEKLEAMSKQYKDRGLLVIGFPSNDFRQELQNDKDIGNFCKMTYGVKFPMISKGAVSGPNAQPFYKELIAATGQEPKWNFHKYVITSNGKVVHAFSSEVQPDDPEIIKLIKPELK